MDGWIWRSVERIGTLLWALIERFLLGLWWFLDAARLIWVAEQVGFAVMWSLQQVVRWIAQGTWSQHAREDFSRHGYLLFVTLIGGYFGLYAVLEARHERGMNRALFERATFMSMISSSNRGSIVAALKNFGPIQTILIPSEPALWPPFHNWFFSEYQPNIEPMWIWALNFFPHCTKGSCGNTHINQGYRLDLQMAKLSGAKLKDVDLHDAILIDADLSDSNLRKSNLQGANLRDANMDGADLREARINKTDLSYARLRGSDLRNTELGLVYPGLPGIPRTLINKPPTAVILFHADLREAKLEGAKFYETDLEGAKGLTLKQLDIICVDAETLRIIKPTLERLPRICPEKRIRTR